MDAKKGKSEITKVDEPAVSYKVSTLKEETENQNTFDFDSEFANGFTPEEFKQEMFKRIKAYPWNK